MKKRVFFIAMFLVILPSALSNECDYNSDNSITMQEVIECVDDWKNNIVSMPILLEAIEIWKQPECSTDSDCIEPQQPYCASERDYQYICLRQGQTLQFFTCSSECCTICVNEGLYKVDDSYCSQAPMCECNNETYCAVQKQVFQDFSNYTCRNPGTAESYCEKQSVKKTVDCCEGYCTDGSCEEYACTNNTQCGTDEWVGEAYCDQNSIYRQKTIHTCINPRTLNAECTQTTQPILVETCSYKCSNGECQEKTVVFRTNGESENYPLYSSWLAMDVDQDGELEGYHKQYTTSISFCPSCRLTDPYGNCVVVWNSKPCVVSSRMGNSCTCTRFDDFSGAETSSLPTEPYASNGQEVYS